MPPDPPNWLCPPTLKMKLTPLLGAETGGNWEKDNGAIAPPSGQGVIRQSPPAGAGDRYVRYVRCVGFVRYVHFVRYVCCVCTESVVSTQAAPDVRIGGGQWRRAPKIRSKLANLGGLGKFFFF